MRRIGGKWRGHAAVAVPVATSVAVCAVHIGRPFGYDESVTVGAFTVGHNVIGIENGQSGITDLSLTSTDKTGTYSSPLDPKLGPLTNNGGTTATRVPQTGSPAIKTGFADFTVQALAPYDQRGFPFYRPLSNPITNVHPDAGAVQT